MSQYRFCRSCGAPLSHARTGRPRIWCSKECQRNGERPTYCLSCNGPISRGQGVHPVPFQRRGARYFRYVHTDYRDCQRYLMEYIPGRDSGDRLQDARKGWHISHT